MNKPNNSIDKLLHAITFHPNTEIDNQGIMILNIGKIPNKFDIPMYGLIQAFPELNNTLQQRYVIMKGEYQPHDDSFSPEILVYTEFE